MTRNNAGSGRVKRYYYPNDIVKDPTLRLGYKVSLVSELPVVYSRKELEELESQIEVFWLKARERYRRYVNYEFFFDHNLLYQFWERHFTICPDDRRPTHDILASYGKDPDKIWKELSSDEKQSILLQLGLDYTTKKSVTEFFQEGENDG
jgi:hypothetical protein